MSLSIGILTHSTNPRGGVVHGMALAEALCEAGHEATLIAPDVTGAGFFRPPRCPVYCIPAQAVQDLPALVECRIGEIRNAIKPACFDVLHAQDPISANALADLVQAGQVRGFARTVHHIDSFTNPALAARQLRGLTAARELFTVSAVWEGIVRNTHGRQAPNVGNGVDTQRFTPSPAQQDGTVRARYGLPTDRQLVLAVGGVERRKNTLLLLDTFLALCQENPALHLVVAGGVSLLEHSVYRNQFDARLKGSSMAEHVSVIGPVADADMPALYRQAAVLAYPSSSEGFGLCPLEALACGTPVVVPDMAPFNEHFLNMDVLWCRPDCAHTLGLALRDAVQGRSHDRFMVSGPVTARRFDWRSVASRHLPAYGRLAELSRAHASLQGIENNA